MQKQCDYRALSQDAQQSIKDCMQCVKSHEFDKCRPSDLLAVCDSTMAGKSLDAAFECATQIEGSCTGKLATGPACMQCLKEHIARIDDGKIRDNKCNTFQLQHFCYFYVKDGVEALKLSGPDESDIQRAMDLVGDAFHLVQLHFSFGPLCFSFGRLCFSCWPF